MRNYKFKHESVLNYRTQIEDTIKREFGELQETLSQEVARRAEFEATFEKNSNKMLSKEVQSPNDMDNHRGYKQFLKARILECSERVEGILGEIERKREELVGASKNKKILEVIKDKGRIEYIKADAKNEQAISDEHNIHKFSK